MNKLSLLMMPALILVATANAAQAEEPQLGWMAELKKAGLEISSTHIKNSEEYKSSPNAELSGDSETMTKGILDFSLTERQEHYKWENNLFPPWNSSIL